MAIRPTTIIDPWSDVAERAKVRIRANEIGGVTGLFQEIVRFGYKNDWRQPFAQILSSFNTGFVAGQELTAKGGQVDWSATLQELKRSVWAGGSTLSFGLDLLYIARRSSRLDVVAPIRRIIQMTAGSTAIRAETEVAERAVSATVVKPPPYVQLEVGYVIRLKRAIINNVDIEITNVSDITGQPTEAKVHLGVESQKMFLADDTEVGLLGRTINVPGG